MVIAAPSICQAVHEPTLQEVSVRPACIKWRRDLVRRYILQSRASAFKLLRRRLKNRSYVFSVFHTL